MNWSAVPVGSMPLAFRWSRHPVKLRPGLLRAAEFSAPALGLTSIAEKPQGEFRPPNHPAKQFLLGRRSLIIFELLGAISILAGCSQTPVVVPEIIRQPVYIPTPATLTNPVSVNLGPNPTWGSALGAYNEALQTCNSSLDAIKTLKSPTPLPDKGSDKPPYK